jgi:hypothetical protein
VGKASTEKHEAQGTEGEERKLRAVAAFLHTAVESEEDQKMPTGMRFKHQSCA